MLTSESGGAELPTVDIGKMIIRSWSGNNVIYVGGVAEDAPYSGHGMPVWPNETFTVPVANMNEVRVFAPTSGNIISVMGFGTAENVDIPVNDPVIPDVTPPSLLSVFPTSGAIDIEIDLQEVTATFSEELLSGSVNTSSTSFTLRLSGSSARLSGQAFVDEENPAIAVFSPVSGQLENSKVYVARVGGAITDVNGVAITTGTWSFTTAAAPPPPDTTRPKVSGFIPVSGATNVAVATTPKVTMSEQIQSGTASSTFFSLRLSGGTVVSNSVQLSDQDNKTVTLAVSGGTLRFSGHYFIVVTSGVKDLAGNNMSGNVSGQFKTLGVTLPRVSGSSPSNGATDVSISVSPTVTWDRAIQSGFVNTEYFDIHFSGTTTGVSRSFSIDSAFKVVTMNPTSDLNYLEHYEVEVQSGVKDLSGNAFSGTFTAFFKTESQPLNIIYNVGAVSSTNELRAGDDTKEAAKVATASSSIHGDTVRQLRVTMRRENPGTTLPGIVVARVWNNAGVSYYTIGSMNASAVTTGTAAEYTFTNLSATYTLKTGDYVGIEYSDGGDADNYIEVMRRTTDVVDSTNTHRAHWTASNVWADETSHDFVGIMWE